MKKFILLISLLFIPVLVLSEENNSKKSVIGKRSFLSNIRTMDGDIINLDTYKNKNYVWLSFFSYTCLPCEKEIPQLQNLKKLYPKIVVILVADTETSQEKSDEFMAKIKNDSGVKIELPISWDKFGDLSEEYGVKSFPTNILLDKSGKVVYVESGFNDDKFIQTEKMFKEYNKK